MYIPYLKKITNASNPSRIYLIHKFYNFIRKSKFSPKSSQAKQRILSTEINTSNIPQIIRIYFFFYFFYDITVKLILFKLNFFFRVFIGKFGIIN